MRVVPLRNHSPSDNEMRRAKSLGCPVIKVGGTCSGSQCEGSGICRLAWLLMGSLLDQYLGSLQYLQHAPPLPSMLSCSIMLRMDLRCALCCPCPYPLTGLAPWQFLVRQ